MFLRKYILKLNFNKNIFFIITLYIVIHYYQGKLKFMINKSTHLEEQLRGPLSPTDPRLIDHIKQRFLISPSNKKYNFNWNPIYKNANLFIKRNTKLTDAISKIYSLKSGLRNGFFVEVGALDGEMGSNSLYLEKELGWTGLLIEPDAIMYSQLLEKNRKAWSCKCCLATKPFPFQTHLAIMSSPNKKNVNKQLQHSFSALIDSKHTAERLQMQPFRFEKVQCFPIESILKALQITKIDLFSLDVEDVEMDILKYFPWTTVSVDVWVVEHRHSEEEFIYKDKIDYEFIRCIDNHLAQLIEDKTLWKYIDFGPYPLTPQIARRYIKYLGKHTRYIRMIGFVKTPIKTHPKSCYCLSDSFFLSLKRRCSNLQELQLIKCYIDNSTTKLSSLPSSLKKLILDGSAFVNLPIIRSSLNSPFFKIGQFFPCVEEINIHSCGSWFSPTDVKAMMKSSKTLKIINDGHYIYLRNSKNVWTTERKLPD